MSGSEVKPKRTPPFSLRLSDEERAHLTKLANGDPLGRFIKTCLPLNGQSAPRRVSRSFLDADRVLLARVLDALGRSRLASNLNQLAKAANSGALPVMPETENDLRAACRDVRVIRHAVIRALGPSGGTSP